MDKQTMQTRIEEIRKEVDRLITEKMELDEQYMTDKMAEFVASGALRTTTWKLNRPEEKQKYMVLDAVSPTQVMFDLFNWYHGTMGVVPAVEIGISDDEIYLSGEWLPMMDFIQAQKLTIDLSGIQKALDELENQTLALTVLKDLFQPED